MKLSEISLGDSVFIDANIFIYHFAGASHECKDFLKACEQGEIIAFTSNPILAEVCHRLMIIEAVKSDFIKAKQPGLQLQKKPDVVKKLSEYYVQITNILTWKIQLIPPPEDLFIRSQIYRKRFGLLTNDSFIPVYMGLIGTNNLASADNIFNSIPHLRLYSPSDIK